VSSNDHQHRDKARTLSGRRHDSVKCLVGSYLLPHESLLMARIADRVGLDVRNEMPATARGSRTELVSARSLPSLSAAAPTATGLDGRLAKLRNDYVDENDTPSRDDRQWIRPCARPNEILKRNNIRFAWWVKRSVVRSIFSRFVSIRAMFETPNLPNRVLRTPSTVVSWPKPTGRAPWRATLFEGHGRRRLGREQVDVAPTKTERSEGARTAFSRRCARWARRLDRRNETRPARIRDPDRFDPCRYGRRGGPGHQRHPYLHASSVGHVSSS